MAEAVQGVHRWRKYRLVTMREWSNKSDPANPAMASRFQAGHRWRGVADPER